MIRQIGIPPFYSKDKQLLILIAFGTLFQRLFKTALRCGLR